MIDAKELRIGNCVSHSDYTSGVFTVFSIEQMSKGGYVVDTKGGKNGAWANPIENIEPIQITEEWLLKLGFEYEDQTGWYNYGSDDCYILCLPLDGYTEVCLGFRNDETQLPDIKTVHQLQNLYFALTGEELTIKLK